MTNESTLTAIRYQRGSLSIVDQLKLPDEIVYIRIVTVDDAWKAIHTRSVGGEKTFESNRFFSSYSMVFLPFSGASAIALCGVLSLAVELDHSRTKFDSIAAVHQFVTDQLNYLITARPTSMNMTDAAKTIIDYLINLNEQNRTVTSYIDSIVDFMEEYLVCDLAVNQAIGRYGLDMLSENAIQSKKLSILTHCNTGSLATIGYGTALGIIRQLAENHLLKLVYFTETRPFNQGSRLTAYELIQDRIPHMLICDSMVGLLMKTQSIDAILVGADYITANGDTINTIGTYQLAVLAQYHQIPFYVAAPTASMDFTKRSANSIRIEDRSSCEITTIKGMNIAATDVQVWNPAFDITPASFITSFVTELGVFKSDELQEKLFTLKRSLISP